MIPDKRIMLIGAGVAAVVGLWLYSMARSGRFDPTSPNNLAYQAASGLIANVTGGAAAGGEDTLGGVFARFREWISGDDARIREMLKGAPPASPTTAGGGAQYYL